MKVTTGNKQNRQNQRKAIQGKGDTKSREGDAINSLCGSYDIMTQSTFVIS